MIGKRKMRWQLQEAKAKLSQLVKRSEREGPQEITVHGQAKAVVLSKADYDRLSGKQPSIVDLMKSAGVYGVGLDVDEGREAPDRATPIEFDKMFD
jgi:prevent-host-death family protein